MFFLFLVLSPFYNKSDTSVAKQIIAIDSVVKIINTDTSLSIFPVVGDAGYGTFAAKIFYRKKNNEIIKIKSKWKGASFRDISFFFKENRLVYFVRDGKTFYCADDNVVYSNARKLLKPVDETISVASGYFINEITCALLKLQ
ncbi:MAG: hypothetical protein HY252_04625 [Sphingobacteriales bacterium]|nr:hypothetical protein [Sphingobacteriales bacterium]